MDQTIKYIKEQLGFDIELTPVDTGHTHSLPVFLTSTYNFYTGKIQGQTVLFAQFKSETILAPGNYAKHERVLKQFWQMPVVFVFNRIQSYNKSRICNLGLNFIVPDSQIFMPELYIILSRTGKSKTISAGQALSPAAQSVLLYHLYGNGNNYLYKQIQNELCMPYPTVCKAIEVLTDSELCQTFGSRDKIVQFDIDKKGLLKRALPLMKSPSKRVIYMENVPEQAYKTGLTALSEYTMINPDEYEHFAISHSESTKLKNFSTEDKFLPIHIEIWNYNPQLFASNGVVDKISLYLSMRGTVDERIQFELNQIIQNLW